MEVREGIGELFVYPLKTDAEVRLYSPITLAYIGDSVYETLVRGYLIREKSLPTHVLSRRAKRFVSAKAQSEIYDATAALYNEEETDVYRRGRNSKAATVPKNTDVIEYKKATGFEAVYGYLYLTGRFERIRELFGYAVDHVEKGRKKTD